jgi:hypothetical protein
VLTSNVLKAVEVEEPRIEKEKSRMNPCSRRSPRKPRSIELTDDSSLLDRIFKGIGSRSCRILIIASKPQNSRSCFAF